MFRFMNYIVLKGIQSGICVTRLRIPFQEISKPNLNYKALDNSVD